MPETPVEPPPSPRGEIQFFLGLSAALTAVLLAMGRRPWCRCGSPALWWGDVWTSHNSQHLFDPYSFTHLEHGLAFFLLLGLLRLGEPWRFRAALLLEAVWEVLENSDFAVQRYRQSAIALEYYGDSVANSLSDLACCATGYWLARRLGVPGTVALFVCLEGVLMLTLHDSMLASFAMFLFPRP